MPTNFQRALLAVIDAERERSEASEACRSPEDPWRAVERFNDADRRLAQAGDVLEQELRQLMREEVRPSNTLPLPDVVVQHAFEDET